MGEVVLRILLIVFGPPLFVAFLIYIWFFSVTDNGLFSFVSAFVTFLIVLGIMGFVATIIDLGGGSNVTNNDYSKHGPTHNHYSTTLYDQRSVHFHEEKTGKSQDKLDQ